MQRVLILGGGYASLSFIKSLRVADLRDFEFTLITQEKEHYESVLLHEVISQAKDITIKYQEILPEEIYFVQDQIQEIKENVVIGLKGQYEYDFLVIALGFNSDDFGIPGVKQYSYNLTNFKNSLNTNQKLQERLKQGKTEIVVCGGGLSGVELLGSLALDLKEKYRANFKLKCIEAMPNIIPMFGEELVSKAKAYLEHLGVEFYLGSKILECKEDRIVIEKNGEQKEIKSDFTFWTAGVKGNEVIANSSLFVSARSKIEVDGFLKPINGGLKNIFVLGDCAALRDPLSERFYPPTAQIASQQGQYLAKIFNSNFELKESFTYQSKGAICSLGHRYAVGSLGKMQITGYFASLAKRFVEFQWRLKLKGLKGLGDF